MVDLYSFDNEITASAVDGDTAAHVQLSFPAGGPTKPALKLLCRVLVALIVEARKKDGVHG